MPSHERPVAAALSVLIILQLVMLFALFAGVAPHPPATTPLFGLGPFIGASLSAAVAAVILGPGSTTGGQILSGLAVLLALVSFGPHKYLDAQASDIWPALVAGQAAALFTLVSIFRGRHRVGKTSPAE